MPPSSSFVFSYLDARRGGPHEGQEAQRGPVRRHHHVRFPKQRDRLRHGVLVAHELGRARGGEGGSKRNHERGVVSEHAPAA
jgi:hypothetical protein